MHIPDGFLDINTCVATATISMGSLSYIVKKVQHDVPHEDIPKMGVISAFIFAAQMINFPVAFGTSGHLIGAALATLLLGPLQAVLVMTSVVMIQAFAFQDGGLMAMGANILNLAIIPVMVTYLINQIQVKNTWEPAKIIGAAWLSVVVTSMAASIQLGIAGTYPMKQVFIMMILWHAVIGIGEGIITYVAYGFIHQLLGLKRLKSKVI